MGKALIERQTERNRVPKIGAEKLNSQLIEEFWPDIEGQLKLIPKHWDELWTLESIYNAAMSGNLQIWALGQHTAEKHIRFELVVITQLCSFPARNVLRVILMFGHGLSEDYIDLLEATLDQYARIQGCSMVDGVLRPGWEKILRKRGVKTRGVYMSRMVNPEVLQ